MLNDECRIEKTNSSLIIQHSAFKIPSTNPEGVK